MRPRLVLASASPRRQRLLADLGLRFEVRPPETDETPLPGEAPDQFNWLHSVAVDSHGDVYAAEVSYVEVGSKLDPPRELVSLRKWRRVKG